ncbi:MAG: hypothetical protein ACI35P_02105 [Bacillus sp. (in: firmicutes)]
MSALIGACDESIIHLFNDVYMLLPKPTDTIGLGLYHINEKALL